MRYGASSVLNSDRLWLWIPAFAGTTPDLRRGRSKPTISPSPSRPYRLAFLGERLQPFLGVFGHRQQRDLALEIGDALVERHRADGAHGIFAAADCGRRLVGDAADQPVDL